MKSSRAAKPTVAEVKIRDSNALKEEAALKVATSGRRARRRPSEDLDELQDQLLRELERLNDASDEVEEPRLYRAYLHYAFSLVWERVYQGDAGAPRQAIDRLRSARWFVDDHLPDLEPKSHAAIELHFTLRSLYLAEETLRKPAAEIRLADRQRSPTEREVLRVLLRADGEYLRRGEVHERFSLARRPSPARIGQILADFYHHRLVLRTQRQAQGGSAVSFYALSPLGREVCHRLRLNREERRLFDFSPELQREYLTPELLADTASTASPKTAAVTAFFGYHGGLGRTTLVAKVAPLLASQLDTYGAKLLVIDLDLDAPSLDHHFLPKGLEDCRGLRGLAYDFYQLPTSECLAWLPEALKDQRYVMHLHDSLYYMPSGFAPGTTGVDLQDEEERAEVLLQLYTEAGLTNTCSPTKGFLHHFSSALPKLFTKTLLDSSPGFSVSAWSATKILSSELILCGKPDSDSAISFKVAASNFLKEKRRTTSPHSRQDTNSISFLLSHAPGDVETEPGDWIAKNVVIHKKATNYRYRKFATGQPLFDSSKEFYNLIADSLLETSRLPAQKKRAIFSLPTSTSLATRQIADAMLDCLTKRDTSDPQRRIAEGLLMGCKSSSIVLRTLNDLVQVSQVRNTPLPRDLIPRIGKSIDIRSSRSIQVRPTIDFVIDHERANRRPLGALQLPHWKPHERNFNLRDEHSILHKENKRPSGSSRDVLIINDEISDIEWLIESIHKRGYGVVLATNKAAARECLNAFQRNEEFYDLVIVDPVLAAKDLADIESLGEDFLNESRNAGFQLCQYAREDLKLSAKDLRMAAFPPRNQQNLAKEIRDLDISLLNREAGAYSPSFDKLLPEIIEKL